MSRTAEEGVARVKSRYGFLRTLGTLSVAIAWILLLLGVLAAVGGWLGMTALRRAVDVPAAFNLIGVVPPLIFAVSSFLWFYIVGKVLKLLVDMDDTTMDLAKTLKEHLAQPQAPPAAAVPAAPAPVPAAAPSIDPALLAGLEPLPPLPSETPR